MINDNENEAGNEKQIAQYDINRPRPRHGHKYTKYKMCLNVCIKVGLPPFKKKLSASMRALPR